MPCNINWYLILLCDVMSLSVNHIKGLEPSNKYCIGCGDIEKHYLRSKAVNAVALIRVGVVHLDKDRCKHFLIEYHRVVLSSYVPTLAVFL